ncbi:MAG: glycoside hydrolase family 2 [Lachnospiraceae bacterium]|nr:glycoside hydrolase family 2 [Lachnospiraceae bacterium]
MIKDKFINLNGRWLLNGKKIVIPFPPQSKLSEYNYDGEEELVYETDFYIPDDYDRDRILLHFGAVDQITDVYVNDKFVGNHEGGYNPFYFDVTETVVKGNNHLTVKAVDRLDTDIPYGKQCKKRGGMWYTPVSGIWQTVWLENVPDELVEDIIITPEIDSVTIELKGNVCGFKVQIYKEPVKEEFEKIYNGDLYESGENIVIDFEGRKGKVDFIREKINVVNWTPEEPYLYIMKIITETETIKSYFALRRIEICDIKGVKRVCLNGSPIFLHGVLDQGYFRDGIYLPQNEMEYDRDVIRMKKLGFNMLRKHIKVEPERFYYACDRLGMLVMQDMVNNGEYSFVRDTALPTLGFKKKKDSYKKKRDLKKWDGQLKKFKEHTTETIKHLYNHPSIVAYTIFNEGWGQKESDDMYMYVRKLDDTRVIDSTSGWFAQSENDFDSRHIYFKEKKPTVKGKPLLVSECGGYKMSVEGHLYSEKSYGYGKCESSEELTGRIGKMYEQMIIPGIEEGICGCIYTQLSDVEDEINGLYTYDREVCKVQEEKMLNIRVEIDKIVEKI